MQEVLKPILEIQELDIQLIQLIRKKQERERELGKLRKIKQDLGDQLQRKQQEILELKTTIRLGEGEVAELVEGIKKLESQQGAIKKVDEFNALTHEISTKERARHAKEQEMSALYDKLAEQEDLLQNLQGTLDQTAENSVALETEIIDSIKEINKEGQSIKKKRNALTGNADEEVLDVYQKLLRNKQDRVIVPIENRCCSGCHIALTAQDENMVRKGERLVRCEHCSRIHYWPEAHTEEGATEGTKRRRRRTKTA